MVLKSSKLKWTVFLKESCILNFSLLNLKEVPYEVRVSYLGFTEEVLNLQVVNKIELNTKYLTDDYIKELEEVIKKYTNEN